MKFKTIALALFALIAYSCANPTPKGEVAVINSQESALKSGLIIENGKNRGTSYTYSLGISYNIRYIPIKITNDSLLPIHFEIAFANEYNYPTGIDDTTFSVIPLPEEWIVEGSEITDEMFKDLPHIIAEPTLSKTLAPGEVFDFGIGTVYALPAKVCGVLPNLLFSRNDLDLDQDCDIVVPEPVESQIAQSELWLKLDFCRNGDSPNCRLVACGNISYLER